ncbi:unnamed protein product [Alternaria alternata]
MSYNNSITIKTMRNMLLVAGVELAVALPSQLMNPALSRQAENNAVQLLLANIHGPDTNALQHVPTNLSSDLRSFLQKYQPLADLASKEIGSKDQDLFTSAGYCFAEFPCFSVERGATVTIGSQEEVTPQQVSAILDQMLLSSTVTFAPNPATSLSGFLLTTNKATLQVIATPGFMSSSFLAGMVFDMYKMQSNSPATNAIRAVQAKTDGKERPFLALCVYPEQADSVQAHNFCLGNELDGTPSSAHVKTKNKRQSIEGLLSTFCALIEFPLICHNSD